MTGTRLSEQRVRRYEAYGVQVLTLIGARVARITSFNNPGLVPAFGLTPALTG